ncbi:MAG TPA: hypothetical protein PKJ41_12080 [Bryobacteraceae bacterium]|nr:hypothetical protein [Bryobacteraceae bacterium]
MSSHDCVLRGQVLLVAGAGLAEVKEAMAEFLEALHDSFDDLASDGHSIVLEGDVLFLHIALQAWGGPECGEASDLANGLGSICREPGYVELLDFDTGDSSEHCYPYFFGKTDQDKLVARLKYGIEQMTVWTEDLIPAEAMVEVERFIRAQSLIAKPKQVFRASFALGTEHIEFQFEAPGESPAVMLDGECLAALAQKAEVDFQPVEPV